MVIKGDACKNSTKFLLAAVNEQCVAFLGHDGDELVHDPTLVAGIAMLRLLTQQCLLLTREGHAPQQLIHKE